MRRFYKATSWIYRVALALAPGSIPVLTAMITAHVFNWSPWTVVWVASGVGIATFFDNLGALAHKFRAHERAAARSRMHTPLVGALDAIADARGVPLSSLGISVFVPRRGFLWPRRKLKRVFRFRLGTYPPPSKVTWTLGKGVIGECWRTGIPVLHDRRAAAAWYGRYGRYGLPNKAQYKAVPPEAKSRFSFKEFIQTIDKYGEILAVPVRHPNTGDLVGVLSIDCLAGAYQGRVDPVLAAQNIEEIAGGAAFTVWDNLPRF